MKILKTIKIVKGTIVLKNIEIEHVFLYNKND